MHTHRSRLAAAVVLASGLSAAIATSSAGASTPPGTDAAVDCAAIESGLDAEAVGTFVEAVNSSNGALVDIEPPFTALIPLDAAFDAIPESVLDSILADPDVLGALLDHHVLPGQNLDVADLAEAGSVASLGGDAVEFALEGDVLVVDGRARVVCADLEIDGAMVQVLDGVLQPPSLAGGAGAPGSSVPGSSVPGSSVPGVSVPGSSVPGAFGPDEQAVARAWETATDSSLTFDDQAAFIERAEELRPTIDAYPTAAAVVGGISTAVQTVTIDGDTATITYTVWFNGVEQDYPPQEATLERVDGEWIVPQEEICAVYAYARNACPA